MRPMFLFQPCKAKAGNIQRIQGQFMKLNPHDKALLDKIIRTYEPSEWRQNLNRISLVMGILLLGFGLCIKLTSELPTHSFISDAGVFQIVLTLFKIQEYRYKRLLAYSVDTDHQIL